MISQSSHDWGPILSTHPLGYKEVIKRSLRLYFASFFHVILFTFLLAIVVFVPRLVSYSRGHDIVSLNNFYHVDGLWLILINIFTALLLVTIFWRLHCTAHYKHESIKEDFSMGVRKVFYLFLGIILEAAIMFAVFAATTYFVFFLFKNNLVFNHQANIDKVISFLVLLGQFFIITYSATLFIFLIPLIAVENMHVLGAIKRSASLAWNHWLRILFIQCVPWFVFSLLTAFIKFILGVNIHVYFLDDSGQVLPVSAILLQILIFAVFIIWPSALLYLQLKDMEIRKHINEAR